MSVSIISCPGCQTLLLSDTAQCPTCQHVFDQESADSFSSESLPSMSDSRSDEVQCGECGEMMRPGLVRCWKCGAFTRKEIADSYARMQSQASPVIYSQPAEDTSIDARAADADFDIKTPIAPAAPAPPPAQDSPETPSPAAAPATEVPPKLSETDSSTDTAEEETSASKELPPDDGKSHSEETGGDVLLDIARQEEVEGSKRKRQRARQRRLAPKLAPGSFLVFCPNGHRIEVNDRYRGMTGRCPKCKSQFYVPLQAHEPDAAEKSPEGVEGSGSLGSGSFKQWLTDVRVHTLDPTKLKLKEGSLAPTFTPADIGTSPDGLLIVFLPAKKGGLFGKGGDKAAEARESLFAHLEAGKPVEEVPADASCYIEKDKLDQLQIVQPAYAAHESMFAGIDVFGPGRIAVRLPAIGEGTELRFASFSLSEYRNFCKMLAEIAPDRDMSQFGMVPLEDELSEVECHYNETKFSTLDPSKLVYYQNDSSFELELLGRKCQACGIIVSEDARKKERIGGKSGKGIAKSKCPKCGSKFGDISLFGLKVAPEAETEATEEAAAEAE